MADNPRPISPARLRRLVRSIGANLARDRDRLERALPRIGGSSEDISPLAELWRNLASAAAYGEGHFSDQSLSEGIEEYGP